MFGTRRLDEGVGEKEDARRQGQRPDPASEIDLVLWLQTGYDSCCLQFLNETTMKK